MGTLPFQEVGPKIESNSQEACQLELQIHWEREDANLDGDGADSTF
jgi:hypothetical protein